MDIGNPSMCDPIMAGQMDAMVSDADTNTNDDCDEGPQLVEPNSDELEFGNTKLENLVLLEGPQQILQLICKGKLMILWKRKSHILTTMLIGLSGFLM
jgi:hypothetical protein